MLLKTDLQRGLKLYCPNMKFTGYFRLSRLAKYDSIAFLIIFFFDIRASML